MKRLLFFILHSSFFISCAMAQPMMRDVFAAMPDSVLPLVTKNNRLDCIDFIENNMEARVRNRMGEYVALEALTSTYARFRTSPLTVMESACSFSCVSCGCEGSTVREMPGGST